MTNEPVEFVDKPKWNKERRSVYQLSAISTASVLLSQKQVACHSIDWTLEMWLKIRLC
jgi:hypothetical protein